ncbi:Hypothetical protein D9617_1g084150 [Elsinoe fawcettii]|nr:Hypothetical protein D9617_1g084150 [Elsinoe fawcettii]
MVQLLSTIAVLAAGLAGVGAYDCYQTGPIWCENPPEDVLQHTLNACWGYMDGDSRQQGALQNLWFDRYNGLPATVCVNTGCNKKLVMQATNLWNDPRYLSGYDCQVLYGIAQDCMTGGTTEYNGWRLRAAPEYGQC